MATSVGETALLRRRPRVLVVVEMLVVRCLWVREVHGADRMGCRREGEFRETLRQMMKIPGNDILILRVYCYRMTGESPLIGEQRSRCGV
jgi:hypothetical protein